MARGPTYTTRAVTGVDCAIAHELKWKLIDAFAPTVVGTGIIANDGDDGERPGVADAERAGRL